MKLLNRIVITSVLTSTLFSIYAQQAVIPVSSPATASVCVDLKNNLGMRSRDVSSENEVTKLQQLLIDSGYLLGVTTGFFGQMTRQAVVKFQSANSISPTGNVGPVTRAKIKSLTCKTETTAYSNYPYYQNSPNVSPANVTIYRYNGNDRQCNSELKIVTDPSRIVNGKYIPIMGEYSDYNSCYQDYKFYIGANTAGNNTTLTAPVHTGVVKIISAEINKSENVLIVNASNVGSVRSIEYGTVLGQFAGSLLSGTSVNGTQVKYTLDSFLCCFISNNLYIRALDTNGNYTEWIEVKTNKEQVSISGITYTDSIYDRYMNVTLNGGGFYGTSYVEVEYTDAGKVRMYDFSVSNNNVITLKLDKQNRNYKGNVNFRVYKQDGTISNVQSVYLNIIDNAIAPR